MTTITILSRPHLQHLRHQTARLHQQMLLADVGTEVEIPEDLNTGFEVCRDCGELTRLCTCKDEPYYRRSLKEEMDR